MSDDKLITNRWNEEVKAGESNKQFPILGPKSKRQLLFISRTEYAFQPLPVLLVPVTRRVQNVIKRQTYKGFKVDLNFGTAGGMQSDFVLVECLDPVFVNHFLVLADELAEKLDNEENSIEVVKTTIQNWLQFFKNQNNFLDDSELTGLYGELKFLLEMIQSKGPSRELLDSWQGPNGDSWDFLIQFTQRKTLAEVKTTVRPKSSISIHGVNQLEPKKDFRCLLNVRFVDRVITKDASPYFKSVPELIEDICQLLDKAPGGSLRSSLVEILQAVGMFEEHYDEYRTKRYKVVQSLWHEIDETFPALSRSKIPEHILSRVDRLQYEFSVAGISVSDAPF